MSTAKSLSEDQIATIRSWAEAGDQLSDIQKRLVDELEIKVTYLETRFLLEDLQIEIKPEVKPEPEEPEDEAAPDPEEGVDTPPEPMPADEETGLPGEDTEGDADVSVTIDQVVRPGALVSGRADFGGGKTAAWWLDQMGRLGLDSDDPDFRPSEAQAMSFQQELQKAIQQSGL